MTDSHAHEQKHPYHLVDPSPWPVAGAISALVMAVGGLWYMRGDVLWLFIVGTLMILATMAVWWRDVIREGRDQGHHTPVVQLGLRYGMVLFIASEVMFFAAFFWAFFNASLFPTDVESVGGVWPPVSVEAVFNPWDLPLMNTLILLSSGCTVTWAHHSLLEGNRRGLILGLAATVFLGLAFTLVQALEYAVAPFGFTDGIYSSTFFMATGFHGFHVIIGTIFLAVCLFRAIGGDFKPEAHFGFEAAAWYWHFVDVVWIFLFVCVYLWGSGDTPVH